MRLPNITGEFRLVDEPELRYTPAGKCVANVRLVASESRENQQTNEWEDGDRVFLSASIWNSQNGNEAEQVAETFVKGERVLVSGQLYARDYDDRDGNKRQSFELKWVTLAAIPGGKPRGQGAPQQQGQQRQQPRQQQGGDPWARPGQQQQAADPWGQPALSDEPPF